MAIAIAMLVSDRRATAQVAIHVPDGAVALAPDDTSSEPAPHEAASADVGADQDANDAKTPPTPPHTGLRVAIRGRRRRLQELAVGEHLYIALAGGGAALARSSL
jgi:hypothetical protein